MLPIFLLGDCLEEQRIELWEERYDDYVVELNAALERLWVLNPLSAIRFADAIAGQASSDIKRANAWSLAQMIIVPLMLFFVLRSVFRTVSLKYAFFVAFGLWLVGGVVIRTLTYHERGELIFFLANFDTLYRLPLELLTFVLGVALVSRWCWNKRRQIFSKNAKSH